MIRATGQSESGSIENKYPDLSLILETIATRTTGDGEEVLDDPRRGSRCSLTRVFY